MPFQIRHRTNCWYGNQHTTTKHSQYFYILFHPNSPSPIIDLHCPPFPPYVPIKMSVSVVKSVALLSTMLLASAQLSSVPRRLRRGTVAIMNEENAGAEFTAKHAHEGEFGRIRQLDELSMSMPVSSLSMNLAIGADESDSPTYVPTFWPTYVPTSGQSLSMQVLASDELVVSADLFCS